MEKIEKLIEEIDALTVVELNDLVKAIEEKYKPEWTIMAVMDAKTGDILASSSTHH